MADDPMTRDADRARALKLTRELLDRAMKLWPVGVNNVRLVDDGPEWLGVIASALRDERERALAKQGEVIELARRYLVTGCGKDELSEALAKLAIEEARAAIDPEFKKLVGKEQS